jgi:hypothetical protein
MTVLESLKADLKKAYEAGVITLDDLTEYVGWLSGIEAIAKAGQRTV